MTLRINGEDRETTATDLNGLLAELGIHPQSVLIEHNGTALRTTEWETVQLQPGDRLEIIRIVAGG